MAPASENQATHLHLREADRDQGEGSRLTADAAAVPRGTISVSGQIGSGKSSVVRVLAGLLDREVVSTGSIQRRLARERGMTTLEFNLQSEQDLSLDDLIDSNLVALHESGQPVVVDSRMAWFFLPESFKVFLVVDSILGARRVLLDEHRATTESYADQAVACEEIRRRQESERKRFLVKYGVDYTRFENFDLVIDTSYASPEVVAHWILEQASGPARPAARPQLWLCPRRLYPTRGPRDLAEEDARRAPGRTGGPRPAPPSIPGAVDVLRLGENFFLYDLYEGHQRASAALDAGEPFVAARIVATGEEEILPGLSAADHVKSQCDLATLQAWEHRHGFRFPGYPPECLAGPGGR